MIPLTPMRRQLLTALAVCCLPTTLASAQEIATSIALGAARLRFEEEPAFTAMTLTPSLTIRSSLASLAMSGTFAQVGRAGWSTQGGLDVAVFSPVSPRGHMLEAAGSLGGSSFPGGASTSQALAGGRLHWLGSPASAWIGAAAGTMFDGVVRRGLRQSELGATLSGASERVTVTMSPTVAGDTLRYSDFLGVVSSAVSSVDASVSIGGRRGSTLPIVGGSRRVWGGVRVHWWIASRSALVVGAGTYPVDVTQGFPAGRYLSLGLQLGERRSSVAQAQSRARELRRIARARGVQAFSARLADDGTIALRVRADRARRVEVSGDVTQWAARTLVRGSDGWWWIRLPRGGSDIVEIALRVDGEVWIAPPGTEPLRDEFGGASGRLVLPPRM